MALEQKQARTLTKREQKQSIKGIQKSKKLIIKNYVESPFALEWPDVTSIHEEEIIALIQKSCSGLRKVESKPPWKQVIKYRGADRKSFLKEYRSKFEENLDPHSIEQNNKRERALCHLIFGYNAVMRGLEKDRVAGIVVKKNVDPGFVTKSFLPGCAKKSIPLVPLNDLDRILKDKGTLGLPHSCMVLGLKVSVKEESNQFHSLYIKMREALNVEEEEEEEVSEDEDVKYPSSSVVDDEKNDAAKSFKLSEAEIRSFHLNRNGTNGRRAFVPHAEKVQAKEPELSTTDFLSLESSDTHHNTCTLQDTKSKKVTKGKSEDGVPALNENFDFGSMILIDASGDEKQCIESDTPEDKPSPTEKLQNKSHRTVKRKAKKVESPPYILAKTKRVKGNPDRKTQLN